MPKCSELKSSVRFSAKVTMYAHGDYEHLFPLSFSPQTGVYVGLTVYENCLAVKEAWKNPKLEICWPARWLKVF